MISMIALMMIMILNMKSMMIMMILNLKLMIVTMMTNIEEIQQTRTHPTVIMIMMIMILYVVNDDDFEFEVNEIQQTRTHPTVIMIMMIMILYMKSMMMMMILNLKLMRFNRGEHIRQASIPVAWESNSNWCSLHFLNNDDLVSVDTSTLKPKAT